MSELRIFKQICRIMHGLNFLSLLCDRQPNILLLSGDFYHQELPHQPAMHAAVAALPPHTVIGEGELREVWVQGVRRRNSSKPSMPEA
jgi:hypothetical protein